MNLEDAITAHVNWKSTLRNAIRTKGRVDAAALSRDDCCDLGKWLHGEGRRRYAAKPAYMRCVEAHASFHREAGRVARLIDQREYDVAERELGLGTSFGEASTNAVVAINRLKREIAAPSPL